MNVQQKIEGIEKQIRTLKSERRQKPLNESYHKHHLIDKLDLQIWQLNEKLNELYNEEI